MYLSRTKFQELKPNVIRITELPIGVWTNRYRDDLERLVEEKKIKLFTKNYTEEIVDFTVTLLPGLHEKIALEVERVVRPVRIIRTNNMVLFDGNGKIRRFHTPGDIITEFCHVRLQFYEKRREKILNTLERDFQRNENKHRFLSSVLTQKLVLLERTENEILNDMKQDIRFPDGTVRPQFVDVDADGFKYLLNIPVRNFSKEKMQECETKIDTLRLRLASLKNTSARDLWRADLSSLSTKL